MKRPSRHDDGFYHIDGNKFKILIGSRQQVWNKTAYKTAGELCHKDLMMNKWGRIVSKKKHATAKREKRLQKHGFFAQKGKFGFVKRSVRSRSGKKHSKTARRGGDPETGPTAPAAKTQAQIDADAAAKTQAQIDADAAANKKAEAATNISNQQQQPTVAVPTK